MGLRPNTHDVSIVIVDDDPMALQSIELSLADQYRTHCFTDPTAAQKWIEQHDISLVLLDLNLPGQNGLSLLRDWKGKFPNVEIVFCSGEVKIQRAIECLREGASDYIVKPFDHEDLRLIVRRAIEKQQLKKRLEKLNPLVQPRPVEFVGDSAAMGELLNKIKLLKKQTHLNVLILGESGTGKELIARLLYQQEGDVDRPFVVVNMPATPIGLMESELFGVERGAFTDAKTSRAGKFELADGGDIFLDEIGDLPLETQAKILRALQEKQIERLGSTRSQQIQFRVISATNRPLADLMINGEFREDLMYRLSDMVLWLPPLRDRREDIGPLCEHFILKYLRSSVPTCLSKEALEELTAYHWPGNVRQLESTIKRALIFNRGPVIERVEIYDPAMFNPVPVPRSMNVSAPVVARNPSFEGQLEQYERKIIEEALRKFSGDKAAAMTELRLSRATFYRKMNQLKINL